NCQAGKEGARGWPPLTSFLHPEGDRCKSNQDVAPTVLHKFSIQSR
ncbi:hypothetical protein pipiens_015678, partial [Culex pipiens pipiens]